MTSANSWIDSPTAPLLDELCMRLVGLASALSDETTWPEQQLRLCGEYGVFRWFIPQQWGGAEWSDADIVRGYLKLSAACLTTTFIITQYTGACRRIAGCDNRPLQEALLPPMSVGDLFATVGISHLTTSRRHLKQPMLSARESDGDFVIDGMAPWVTGGLAADHVVVGATLDNGEQVLACVPTGLDGIVIPPAMKLVGLSACQTGPMEFHQVRVARSMVLAGPVREVMKQGIGARTGGVQTSTLATGLANAAVQYLRQEAEQRHELVLAANAFHGELERLEQDVLRMADGDEFCSNEELRTRANSLALRASQAALSAAKGTGYVVGHPAGRWCQEALFFLVWSCPQPVMTANLCELAGISD